MHPLLTLCARTQPDPATFPQLIQQVNTVNNWPEVLAQANVHGLGPLLYFHLKVAEVGLPPEVKRELAGLYLRHRHANGVRAQVAAEILAAFQAEGIQVLTLKGIALAHLLYPEPALRPMSDIDLLLKPAQARQAQEILAGLGFDAPLPLPDRLPGKHLANATRQVEGLTISVELHHNLFNIGHPHSLELDELVGAPLVAFALGELTAYTLPHEEMLWHLCQHLTIIGQPFRLIWLADIVGLAERFAPEIDWRRVQRNYPDVLSALSLFHYITPLSAQLRQVAALKNGPVPAGVAHPLRSEATPQVSGGLPLPGDTVMDARSGNPPPLHATAEDRAHHGDLLATALGARGAAKSRVVRELRLHVPANGVVRPVGNALDRESHLLLAEVTQRIGVADHGPAGA